MLSLLYPAFTSLMTLVTRSKGLVSTMDRIRAMTTMAIIINASKIMALRLKTSIVSMI